MDQDFRRSIHTMAFSAAMAACSLIVCPSRDSYAQLLSLLYAELGYVAIPRRQHSSLMCAADDYFVPSK